jgi:hypothetical protein
VGYKFSLILSREITDSETATLKEGGCACAVFTTDTHPTNAEVTVTKLDFDDTTSPSLAEAIESGLEAVKAVSDLSVPGLTVPAQPAQAPAEGEDAVVEGVVVEEEPPAKKPASKPRAKRASAKKAAVASAEESADGEASAELVDAATGAE